MLNKLKSIYLRFSIWRMLRSSDYKKDTNPSTIDTRTLIDFDTYIIEQFLLARLEERHIADFKDMKISYNIATPLKLSHADTLDVNLRANRIYAICSTYTGEVVSGYIPMPHQPQPLSYYLSFNRDISIVRNRIKSMVLLEVFDDRVNLVCIRVW